MNDAMYSLLPLLSRLDTPAPEVRTIDWQDALS